MRRRATMFGLLAVGCAAGSGAPLPRVDGATIERPSRCEEVPMTEDLARRVLTATRGDVLCLGSGRFTGALEVPAGVTVWGRSDSVIASRGEGTTIRLRAGAHLLGLTVDGSGGRFDVLDAAVHVEGDGGAVQGVTIEHAFFGILAEKASHLTVRGNRVIGLGGRALGLRGDGIRLWEVHDSVVEQNRVENARDCVVWYSRRNRIARNEVRGGRYGTHFMYSHDNEVTGNLYVENEVGVFVMYSRNLRVEGNALLSSGGSAGMGLGLKESGNLEIRGNVITRNTLGVFFDNSPLEPGDHITLENNDITLSDVGVAFLSSQSRITARGNRLRDNRAQVRVESGGDALGVTWTDNTWDDYAGYDLDGDGVGDLPYELSDLADSLVARHPDLTFFTGTPALALVSLASHVAPLLAPKRVLVDARPLLEVRHASRD